MQKQQQVEALPQKLQPFFNFHGIQLFGSKFPMELVKQLHHKITNRVYDAGEYFKIFDNPDNENYQVHATRPLKAKEQVFLVDHAISFRYPQLRGLLASNPNILDRLDSLTKYLGHNKQLVAAPAIGEDPRNVEFDCLGLTDLKNIEIDASAVCLSVVDNKLEDAKEVIEVVGKLKELRALWYGDNPIEGSEQLRQFILEKTSVELLNRKLTAKATTWVLKYVTLKSIEKAFSTANTEVFSINADDRDLLNIDLTVLMQFPNLRHISMLETDITELEQLNKLIQILKLPGLIRIDVEPNVEQQIFKLFSSNGFECSRKLLVNGHNVFMPEPTEIDAKIDRVHSRVFKLAGCYRLANTEKLDETAVWYVNDELGSSMTHSDTPEVVLVPFLYSRNLTAGDQMEAFTIMWPIKDIQEGQIVERDYLCGLPQSKQRSSRLAAWYDLPKQIFYGRFDEFDKNMTSRAEEAAQKLAALSVGAAPKEAVSGDKKVWKILTDSSLLTDNLTSPNFAFTTTLEQADILWFDAPIGQEDSHMKKAGIYMNQFPFEACLVMKNNLANTVQSTLGNTNFLQRTYDLQTQLPIFLGHFYRNQQQGLDNLWICKPPNMARSMDMLVSDNLSTIVRNMETGPKLVQKYISNPVKRLNRKIDLRFILMLQSVQPLQAYLYRHFWIRTSNNEYNLDCRFREEYETHFTVMNYGKKLTQVMHPEFVEQFDKDYTVKWSIVHQKIRQLLIMTLLAAQLKHPEMHSDYSRAVYGVDIMIDEDNFEPKLLEFTFSPDCIRACKFYPTFYNEILEALFLGKLSENIDKLF